MNSYFSTWSEGDLAAYKAHFDPAATIKYVEDGHVVMSDGLSEFIDMQTQFIAAASPGTHEDMTSYEVHSQDGVAWVRANWVLVQGPIQTRGVDQFTLLQDESGAWRIISLVFYEY